jgi:hypothetical protein
VPWAILPPISPFAVSAKIKQDAPRRYPWAIDLGLKQLTGKLLLENITHGAVHFQNPNWA